MDIKTIKSPNYLHINFTVGLNLYGEQQQQLCQSSSSWTSPRPTVSEKPFILRVLNTDDCLCETEIIKTRGGRGMFDFVYISDIQGGPQRESCQLMSQPMNETSCMAASILTTDKHRSLPLLHPELFCICVSLFTAKGLLNLLLVHIPLPHQDQVREITWPDVLGSLVPDSHDMTFNVVRIIVRFALHNYLSCVWSFYIAGQRQGGHTLQGLWPEGIPDEPICPPKHVLSQKNTQEVTQGMVYRTWDRHKNSCRSQAVLRDGCLPNTSTQSCLHSSSL